MGELVRLDELRRRRQGPVVGHASEFAVEGGSCRVVLWSGVPGVGLSGAVDWSGGIRGALGRRGAMWPESWVPSPSKQTGKPLEQLRLW